MTLSRVALAVFFASALVACGQRVGNSLTEGASGDMETYEAAAVNAIEQARPQIMVIPGDQTLQNFQCVKTEETDGRKYVLRDYQKYLLKDDRARNIIAAIQDAFNVQGYPLNDFEQTLKQLSTQEATDMADNLAKDAKTLLLSTAQPDIILELNYQNSHGRTNLTTHDYSSSPRRDYIVSYTLTAIDAYTNKVVATISANEIKGESPTELITESMKKQMSSLQADIQKYFSDILTRGRDINVRVAVAEGCNVKLTDESIEGDTYADWIVDYVKTHTVKGAYKLQSNTDNELSFVNCRIRLINTDGTQYGVYDWTRDLARNLRKNLGLKVTNKARGLGEVLLVIEQQ